MILELSIVNSSKSVFTILCLMKFCLPSNCVSARIKGFPLTQTKCMVGIEKFPVSVVTHLQRTVNTRIQDGVYCIMFSIL